MKKLITIKADPSEIARWRSALDKDGKTLAEVARAALDRFAARIEKRDAQ